MLSELRIRDLGVIDEAVLEFGPGLTVLTGETGAGKTMIVTALGLLLGSRADSNLVRAHRSRAVVEGVVRVESGHAARERAADAGADTDDEDLVLVRIVTREGRSRAHVGGRVAPIGVLAEVGQHLVAVHGQADQWRLRRPEQHRDLLDRFGWEHIEGPLTAYRSTFRAHRDAAAELHELTDATRERAREVEALTAALERIERVDPQPGEDEKLAREAERLGHVEELRNASGEASTLLAGTDDLADGGSGILGALHRVKTVLERAGSNDPQLAALAGRASDLSHVMNDLASDLAHYVGDLDADPARLEGIHQRRAALAELTRLYGPTANDVLAWSRDAAIRLSSLVGDDDRLGMLQQRVAELDRTVATLGAALTDVRARSARDLTKAISEELVALAMPAAKINVTVSERNPGREGADDVEIGWSANSGSDLRSVAKVASGGELSRIMLAIEVATAAGFDGPDTLVFDEVDAGIGGRAALAVGARLAVLATHTQVIVVTHLAQVAAYADHHLVIRKADDGHITRSGVSAVVGEDRVLELARMLGGTDSLAAQEHARDLLDHVRTSTADMPRW